MMIMMLVPVLTIAMGKPYLTFFSYFGEVRIPSGKWGMKELDKGNKTGFIINGQSTGTFDIDM